MKHRKILRWASVLLVGIVLAIGVFSASSQHAYAASGTPINNPGQEQTTCEADGDPLSWLLCPVFNGISDTANYLFENIVVPFLKVPPVSTNPQDASFQVWSTFRIYGNIVLVIAILVVVFGEVIGGGVVDAYTARKILPRILVAVILVNLSVYIVAALVDLTNVIGNGVGDIIIAPFKNNRELNFNISASAGLGVFGIGFLGLFATGGAIAVTLLALFSSPGIVVYMGLMAVLPIIFAIIAVFATLIFRQGAILFLVMVSPVAFALYCLPNTERVFRRWWDLLLEALMVYPIVIIIFAVADVLAGTILQANNIDLSTGTNTTPPNFVGHTLAAVTAFGLQFAPLFLVPFAFRMASGTLGRVQEAFSKGSTSVAAFAQQRAENHKFRYGQQINQARDRLYKGGQSRSGHAAAAGHRGRQWMYDTFLTNRVGSNPQADDSRAQAEMNERIAAITNTGKDGVVRGLTVDKDAALSTAEGQEWRMGVDEFGRDVRQFKTAGGGWVNESDVDKAHLENGNNKYAFQSAMSYEMTKAASQDEVDHLVQSYAGLAEHHGLTQDQASSVWTGAAYGNQNQNLEYKHTKWTRDPSSGRLQLQADGNSLLKEVDEKRGTYQMGQQNADTWTAMSGEVLRARGVMSSGQMRDEVTGATRAATNVERAAAQQSLDRASRIARTYKMRGGVQVGEEGAEGVTAAGTGAAGRVQEEIDRFLELNPDDGYNPSQAAPRTRRGGSA